MAALIRSTYEPKKLRGYQNIQLGPLACIGQYVAQGWDTVTLDTFPSQKMEKIKETPNIYFLALYSIDNRTSLDTIFNIFQSFLLNFYLIYFCQFDLYLKSCLHVFNFLLPRQFYCVGQWWYWVDVDSNFIGPNLKTRIGFLCQ